MPTYEIVSDTTVVEEGSRVTFTVNTTDVADLTNLYWTTARYIGNITVETFTDQQLAGTISVENNRAIFTRTIDYNTISEGAKTFAIHIRTGSATGNIVATSETITIKADPFNPNVLGLESSTGISPSRTVFAKSKTELRVVSDGLPAPAVLQQANSLEPQNYDFNFAYRAGQNTQSPQDTVNADIGIFANGVVFKQYQTDIQIPNTNIKRPRDLNFHSAFWKQFYDFTFENGRIDNGKYIYQDGAFFTSSWSGIYERNSYFREFFIHPDGHSQIIGWCFDGYPIYGPIGYQNSIDPNSGTKRLSSSWRTKLIDAHRPGGWKYDDILPTPKGDVTLAPGAFIEDYEYTRNWGDLDEHNGRYCVTPDFPNGTYAYFLTFDDQFNPVYPYIVGPTSKQKRSFRSAVQQEIDYSRLDSLWNIPNGQRLATLIERNVVDIELPVANGYDINLEIISGDIPNGTRLVGNRIVGTVYEVAYDTLFTAVIRASIKERFEDRTVELTVSGPDDPQWVTNEGLLRVGKNNSLFILDSAVIDYQLVAVDTDLSAGDKLDFFLAEGDGTLPPGITLTRDGRLQGVTEPLLSLDKRFQGGGYDTMPFGDFPLDYGIPSSNGYSSFFYDTAVYGYNEPVTNLRKLNRYYPFAVTVTDGETFVKREFNIYVVGDDFLKADNTVMSASTGIFTADNTHVRTPTWITPSDLGFKRANNYVTLYLDVIDNPTLEGLMIYTLEDINDDGTVSELPPGMSLDSLNGEITGRVPYQPAITSEYKFTVRATRFTTDLDRVTVFANYYEDVLLGNTSFKIFKIDRTGDIDGINDLFELIGNRIVLEGRQYTVTNVDDRNPNYDVIFLDQTLAPSISLIMSRTAQSGENVMFVNRLKEQEKTKYKNTVLKFAENESYTITDIQPYIEYELKQQEPSENGLIPYDAIRTYDPEANYFNNDIAQFPDTKFYKYNGTTWTEISETIDAISTADKRATAKRAIEDTFGGTAYINVIDDNTWRIVLLSTAQSRIFNNIRNFFAPDGDSTQVQVKLIRDSEDRLQLDKNLSRQLNQGRNIGVALFRNDGFSKDFVVAANDEVDIPSTAKTFSLKVIGEIDSNIRWLTPPDLGTINANRISTFRVVAETTVPDTKMVYELVGGRLPFGMYLSYDGEIIGEANQFADGNLLGLTTFDNQTMTWDGFEPGDTTFDREYKFTVKARDRFNLAAIEQEFTLKVNDLDNTQYTNIYMRPMLPESQREYYRTFISNPDVFEPSKIYRPQDPTFGLQKNLDMLVYAGIEAKDIGEFVAAAAKNHKRKKYILGDIKSAKAQPIGEDEIYEVIYIEVKDPSDGENNSGTLTLDGEPTGKTRNSIKIKNKKKITADSVQYHVKDDVTKLGAGYEELPIYTRQIVRFVITENEELIIETRDSQVTINTDQQDFDLEIRDTGDISIELQVSETEPYRLRPTPENTIKADSNAIKANDSFDQTRYISNITNMRNNISAIGNNERNFLPLWMRTSQNGFQELDYITAIPICFVKPGFSEDILNNIKRYGFNPRLINYDIDRYIIKRTDGKNQEQFVIFANYQFNV